MCATGKPRGLDLLENSSRSAVHPVLLSFSDSRLEIEFRTEQFRKSYHTFIISITVGFIGWCALVPLAQLGVIAVEGGSIAPILVTVFAGVLHMTFGLVVRYYVHWHIPSRDRALLIFGRLANASLASALTLWLVLNLYYPLLMVPRIPTSYIALNWALHLLLIRGFHLHR